MAQINYIPFSFPGLEDVYCAFSTRVGGACKAPYDKGDLSYETGADAFDVRANRTALAASLGISSWKECRQVHGSNIIFEPASALPEDKGTEEGDGLATSRKGLGLVIKTADCQPILLAHSGAGFVAALHNGWRGNSMSFPTSGVKEICEHYGVEPHELMAVRGPSLSPAFAEFINFEDDFGPGFEKYYDQQSKTVDLWKLTRHQLVEAGLKRKNIYSLDLCTYAMKETFFSYRRAKDTGRQMSIIWKR
jgi:hypothetical protein